MLTLYFLWQIVSDPRDWFVFFGKIALTLVMVNVLFWLYEKIADSFSSKIQVKSESESDN